MIKILHESFIQKRLTDLRCYFPKTWCSILFMLMVRVEDAWTSKVGRAGHNDDGACADPAW